MIKAIRLVIILTLLELTSCGLKLTVMNGEHFTKDTTLSIGNYEDEIGTVKELSNLLRLEGFNVVSPSTASNAVQFKDPFNGTSTNEELQKIFNVKDLNSIYSIKLNYQYIKNFSRYSYTYFNISIIDPKGKVIMYGFDHGFGEEADSQRLLKNVAKKLAKQIK